MGESVLMEKDNDRMDEFMEKLAELPEEGLVVMETSLNALLMSSLVREQRKNEGRSA